MPRTLVVPVLLVAVALAAGCSTARDGTVAGPAATTPGAGSAPPGTPSGVPGTAPPDGSGPAGGNTREVCAAARQAGSAAGETFVAELGRMLAAAGAGDTRTSEQARRAAEAALADWSGALREQSAHATDPRLRAALADVAGEVGTLRTDLDSLDETRLDRVQQRVDQLCAG
ncbi:hypothetical protein AB0J86_23110 [Micromonospora sp. NPDC049559]|uniref:hypothetical protein n=1 Tax=Micromonospora sp. NPDC049559 TaxID=3155923 RepID=UPI00341C0709